MKRVARTCSKSDRCLSSLREWLYGGLCKRVTGVEQIGSGRGAKTREESIFGVEVQTVVVQDKQGRMLLILGIYRAPSTIVYYVIDTSIFRGTREKHDILEKLLTEVE